MIQTPMSDKMIAEGQGEELDKMLKTFVPMKRLGRSEEIADAVPRLCSDAANYRPVDLSRWRLCDALENGAAAAAPEMWSSCGGYIRLREDVISSPAIDTANRMQR
jgi:hypothetical protein